MPLAKGNLYVAVHGADHAGIVVNRVNPARRQTDVVNQRDDLFRGNDFLYGFFNVSKTCSRFLHPGAYRHAHV